MPRANRYIVSGCSYHITHRCHDRSFLFQFAKDRNGYRKMLRSNLKEHPVALLGYCITSNHIHLLLRVLEGDERTLSRFMQHQEGQFAQYYNQRKGRSGSFWSDRYHAVMIDSGSYLVRCLAYIDLNMVRAGKVEHPKDWDWCGYGELAQLKTRNRLINQKELLGEAQELGDFREYYLNVIEESIAKRKRARESQWTESLAVGSQSFTDQIKQRIDGRMQLIQEEEQSGRGWIIKEPQALYCAFSA